MSKDIKLCKGFNIPLEGKAERITATPEAGETVALKPTDFYGLRPVMMVKEGDEVRAGSPLFHDKQQPEIRFASPVSGEVVSVSRGAKRAITEVRILADKQISYLSLREALPSAMTRGDIISWMLDAGLWPFVRQRPFSVIANPGDKPKSIFISAFDTAPLAPDYDFIVHDHGEEFQTGLDAVSKLTDGKVHLNVNGGEKASKVFTNSRGVQINQISGPHPAGNVGVQIHHIDPISKGDIVWYINPQDILIIGRCFMTGKFDATRIIALSGSEVKHPKYYKTVIGASLKTFCKDNIKEGKVRCISGNVLTGKTVSPDGYVGYYDSQVTVIPEGDEAEFMGWLLPQYRRPSVSRSFLSTWLKAMGKGINYRANTNMHGEERAFVMTGQYEKLLPMDVYPVHLVKASIIGDIELMENLGIYEVDPEDMALCEFACTSKIPVQKIIRQGLDLVKKECFS